MGILGSVTRYLKTYGRLMYADPRGFGTMVPARRKKKSPKAAYLEMLEPRVLMTTVYGGEVFQYTDALGRSVTASLNGNVIAELVSAAQVGGTNGRNVTATGGYLMFGDIAGKFTAGPRAGVIIGNGSIPVDNGTQGFNTRGNANAHINAPGNLVYPAGDNWPDLRNGLPGNQMNLRTLTTDASGNTYTLNFFDVQNNGSLTISPFDPQSTSQDWTVQVIQVDNSTMLGNIVYSVDSDALGSPLPMLGKPAALSNTQSTYTYAEVDIKAAAFNPIDGNLYFEIHDTYTFTTTGGGGGGGGPVSPINEDRIFSFNPTQPANGFTLIADLTGTSIPMTPSTPSVAEQSVTGMAFTRNASDGTTATLYISEQPTAAGLTSGPPQRVRLLTVDVATDATFDPTAPIATFNLDQGFTVGNTRSLTINQLNNIVGLSVLPSTEEGGGDGFLFAVVNSSGSSYLSRIDLTPLNGTANGTAWGDVTDLYESTAKKAVAPFDGQALTGLTYNPTLVDPFTGKLGAFMSIDLATTNLDFINHRLRINSGDVYSVYTSVADINASIVFQGSSFYTGDSGALGGTATPGTTGTVFIGYKGQIPDNSTNDTFAASTPFLTGAITSNLGVLPGLVADTTVPSVVGAPTDKLFAGLDVSRSLEYTFNSTASILSQTLGDAFNNITGLAISPEQQIVVANSFTYNGALDDQLAFVNATTGTIDPTSPLYDVVLNGSFTPLRNIQALSYGNPNLDDASELYAVYDLGDGNGPTLGTIAFDNVFNEAVFTPIQALGLGAHGKVSSIAFTPGGTAADRTHESLYVVADPNAWDFNGTQYLYQANLTFGGGSVTGAVVNAAPTYDGEGNVVDPGSIGPIADSSGNALRVVSMVFDSSGNPLVLDRFTGQLEDINLTTGETGVNFLSGVGQINPTVAGIALDPVTLKFFVADNLTGVQGALTITGTDTTPISASSIMMQLKNFGDANSTATSLGKFMVDGTISGKITVPGSMDLLYAGWLMTGDATAASTSGTWIIPATVAWGPTVGGTTPQQDTVANENYFHDNIFIGGDIRNIIALTDMGTNGVLPTNGAGEVTSDIPGGLTGLEITVEGKIGQIFAKGSFAGVVHAGNQTFVPGIVDATPMFFGSATDVYGYTFRGSATGSSGIMELTNGIAGESGSAFGNNVQSIDSFTASFTSTSLPVASGTNSGFDGGFAFVVQNQGLPALGSTGSGLGLKGILHSAGLGFFYDPTTDVIRMQLLTNGATVGQSTSLGTFVSTASGTTLNVTMTYSSNTLLVDVVNLLGINFTASYAVNLASILGSHAGYVGFTGSTGTQGSTTEVGTFIFNGSTPGTTQLAETDIQHYNVDADFSFAAGYLTANGTNAPFSNTTFQTAQFLGSVRNSAAGQGDTIHLAGVLEGTAPGNNQVNQRVDYYSFALLAGQTVDVNVIPRTELDPNLATAFPGTLSFAIYDPDGNQIATDLNWKNSQETLDRTIRFTADRPGAYRVAITGSVNHSFTAPASNPGNITYDLTVKNAGNMGIGAVVARGQIVLTGSQWIANSTGNTGSTIINPSIWADSGDVGLIQAGAQNAGNTVRQSIVSTVFSSGLSVLNDSNGYSYTGTSSKDVFVATGNLRAMMGGEVGAYFVVNGVINITGNFDVNVKGAVGLIQSAAGSQILYCTFSQAAGGNIQVVSAGGMLYSVLRTNQAIGVIRCGSEGMAADDNTTVIQVDADRTGGDGVIDLIDDTGVWNGAPIISGPGGNVRFMRVGGTLFQDPLFETTSAPSNNGRVIHDPGSYTFTDDSGAVITLTPSTIITTDTTGALTGTVTGQLTTGTYGIRGTGGQVLVDVTSTTGLIVSVAPGGTGRSIGDIGTVNVQGAGVPVTVVNGIPSISASTGGMTDVTLTSTGGAVVNALDIRGTTIDHITNNSGGDILNVNAPNVGVIVSAGNIGTVSNTTGAALVPATVNFGGGAFPFDGSQYAGVNVTNVGLIQAAKSIGNVVASGVIGTITANAGGASAVGSFYGLTGLVVISGSAAQTSSINTTVNGVATTNTVTTNVSISNVNIGQGIAYQGSAETPMTGIYANGKIMRVTGTDADIRGNIVSTSRIGTVSLTNGSIINSQVDVYSAWNMVDSAYNNSIITLPNPTTIIDQPVYVIDLVTIQGTGGILGSRISGSSINTVVVGASGYGIINSDITGVDIGTIHSISAGGYGIIRGTIFDARVQSLSATGSGAPMALATLATALRSSELNVIDPSTNASPNNLNDLDVFFFGDGQPYFPTPWGRQPIWWGLATGVIGEMHVFGIDSLGTVAAYDIRDSKFNFPASIGAITVRHVVDDTEIITGKLASVNVAGNATNMEVSVAGQIGPVFIGGNFEPGTNSLVTALSQIAAKGANGNITSLVVKGNFGGLLLADGSIGTVVIGTAGTATIPGTGDLTGTVTVGANHLTTTALGNLKIYGSITDGGLLDLTGLIGTIDVGNSITITAQPAMIQGSVANLFVGDDPAVNGSDLANTVTLTGNLANAIVTGKMSGALIVEGNVSKFALNTDAATAGTTPFTGSISVGGTLTGTTLQGGAIGNIVAGVVNGVTVGGNLAGVLVGGRTILSATIQGTILSGASVSALLGDIKLLTVKGDINGSVLANSGVISNLNFTGAFGATGAISAQSMGTLTVPTVLAGSVNITNALTLLKAGSVAATASITAGSLAGLTTTGDLNGTLNLGDTTPIKAAVGGNFGAHLSVGAPLTMTVAGNMLAGASIIDSNALTSLTVKGSLAGSIIVDRLIGTIAAGSMANAVIAAGQGLNSLQVTGLMTHSLVNVGLSRGEDNTFGTNDLNEQARMGDLGTLAVGTMSDSVVAVGGNIGKFTAPGNMSDSSVSSGLVLSGTSLAAVLADATPLASLAELNAARQGATLLHGNITSVTVGKATSSATLFTSAISAGVSPGADGIFGTADDNVNTSLTGGTSLIGSFKGALDANSHLEANAVKTVIPGLQLLNYTTGAGSNTILAADPISGAPTLVVTTAAPGTITIGGNTLIIKVTGPAGSTVSLYDNATTADRLDTLLISSTASGAVSVTVTSSNPNALAIGRVIATDNTQVGNFTFNGDILGDAAGGPAVWIDSDMASFTVRNLANDLTWNGAIGGNVAKLSINQLGPGLFRVGGRVTTLTVASSAGNPLLQQLGTVSPGTTISQFAYNPLSGQVYASDGTNLFHVDPLTGATSSSNAIHTLLTNAPVSLSGLAFDTSGTLFGVATLNNQNPVDQIGRITTTGDTLRGLAVNSAGVIYAIDSQSGIDKLVTIDPTTGAETLAGSGATPGVIRDSHTNTFTNNITALAFDQNGNLLALTNDRDGNGGVSSTANGFALGKIVISANGAVNFSSPVSQGAAGDPIFITGGITNPISAMAVTAAGGIYVVETVAGVQRLDTLTIAGAAVTRTIVGNIKLGAANTSLVGIGFDESGTLIGMNLNGTASELIGINALDPTQSVRLDAPALIGQSLAGFAVGKSGTNLSTYAYTTNAATGGMLFVSPGVTSTLGSLDTNGGFTQLLPLARNNTGAPLLGNVTGVAVDAADNIFAISDQGVLAEYSSVDGSLIGGAPIGVIKNNLGAPLQITRIAFNTSGELIGLSASGNNLVSIGTTSTLQNGVNIVLANNVTDLGTTDATDLTGLAFDTSLNMVLGFSTASKSFVNLLGTAPASVGGLIVNSAGTANLPAAFTGRLLATGGGGAVVQGLDNLKIVGTGTFTGNVAVVNSIGNVTGTGVTFDGSIISHADITSVVLTGSVGLGGVVSADTLFKTFTLTGSFDGRLAAQSGTTFTIKGAILSDGLVGVADNLATLSVTGSDGGVVSLGSNKTMAVTGQLTSGAIVDIRGVAGAITVSGGMQLGSLLLAHDLATTVTIGGMLAGVVGVRKSITTAVIANASNGIFTIGGDITTLNVTGNVTDSVLAAGIWIGSDGVYNTSDDVIYGGSIGTAKVTGVFTDSLITAGVLPPEGVNTGANNVPLSYTIYDYNPGNPVVADIDGAQGGGLSASVIGAVTFSKPVISSNPGAGIFSALVAADRIGKVTTVVHNSIRTIIRNDPPGAPLINNIVDPLTGVIEPDAVRFSPGEIRITFNEPLDTSTLNSSTFTVTDSATGNPISDVTFGYFQQTAADGTTQSVVQLLSAGHFAGLSGLTVDIKGSLVAPTVAGRSGLRSALLLYPNDPFGVTYRGNHLVIAAPSNDNLANANNIVGTSVVIHASNIHATAELNEPPHGNYAPASSVWWTWTAPSNGPIQFDTSGSDFSTTLEAYSATASNFASLSPVGFDSNGSSSRVRFVATAGTLYYIVVDGVNQTGNIQLNVSVPVAPANDNFSSAQTLTGFPAIVTGSNFLATGQVGEPTHGGNPANASVWYQWTATASQAVSVTALGSNFGTVVDVYSGSSLATLSPVALTSGPATIDAFDKPADLLQYTPIPSSLGPPLTTTGASVTTAMAHDGPSSLLLNGDEWLFRTDPAARVTQGSTISAWVKEAAAGGRTYLGFGSSPDQTLSLVMADNGIPGLILQDNAGLAFTQLAVSPQTWIPNKWYRMEIVWGAGGVITGNLYDSNGTTLLNTISAVDNTVQAGGIALRGINRDSFVDTITTTSGGAFNTFNAVAGTTYYVSVDGLAGATGDITLALTPVTAPNDNFANASTLVGFPTNVTAFNTGATLEVGEPLHAGVTSGKSVWWNWTAPLTGTVTVSTAGSNFDTVLGVYTGSSIDALTPVVSNDDAVGLTSQVTFTATAGTTYRILVAGYEGAQGMINLTLS